MSGRFINLVIFLLASTPFAIAQRGAAGADAFQPFPTGKVDTRPFNPRELSGPWWGELYGYSVNVPPMTPEGEKRFNANKPSYGRLAGSADAAAHSEEHIGRRRAIPPALNNDPVGQCNPLGLIRLLLYSPAPFEIVQTGDRIHMFFEWTWDRREIWTDGRALPNVDDYIPRYNGFSVGRWEGDTLIVDTVGFDDRQWIDHFGYPISSEARLQERWRRVDYSTLELTMTLTDPFTYTQPWVGDLARFKMVPKQTITTGGWTGLVEDRCVPADEVEEFNKKVRDPAGGVTHD